MRALFLALSLMVAVPLASTPASAFSNNTAPDGALVSIACASGVNNTTNISVSVEINPYAGRPKTVRAVLRDGSDKVIFKTPNQRLTSDDLRYLHATLYMNVDTASVYENMEKVSIDFSNSFGTSTPSSFDISSASCN